jgi:hypothetical protein
MNPLTFESTIHFMRRGRGSRKAISAGPAPLPPIPGRVPRISRLMALAIRFDQLIQAGDVADYAELARVGHVTRARMTQIMNLGLLAPDIQEELLFLPRTERGRDRFFLRDFQPIAAVVEWKKQRRMWKHICRKVEADD